MLQIVYNFIIEWFWIDTNGNKLSDHLSRGREDEFLRDAHGDGTSRLASEYNRVADDLSRGYGEGSPDVAPDALRFAAEYLSNDSTQFQSQNLFFTTFLGGPSHNNINSVELSTG